MEQKRQSALDRRAALAGAAGLLLAPLSRSVVAGDVVEDGRPVNFCCGNGPPNVALYGVGMNISSPQPLGPSVQFDDNKFGKNNRKGTWFWVFVPDQDDHSMSYTYTDPNGPRFWVNPTGFVGIVYCVDPANTLVLTWPGKTQPTFSTRPINVNEPPPPPTSN